MSVGQEWLKFKIDHAEWIKQWPEAQVKYALPESATSHILSKKFFTNKILDAEVAFTCFCKRHNIIGVTGDHFIVNHLLTYKRFDLTEDDIKNLNLKWSQSEILDSKRADNEAEEGINRLCGVAGRLLTEPQFCLERDALKTEAERIFGKNIYLGVQFDGNYGSNLLAKKSKSRSKYEKKIKSFLGRWGLTGMATWDLPVPQGPLIPNFLAHNPASNPTSGIHIFLPIHYPFQTDDQMLRKIRRCQQQAAERLGLPRGFAGVAHYAQYAQMFRLIHFDRSLDSRFETKRPPGYVSWSEEVAMDVLELTSTASVRRLRSWIKLCWQGKRNKIKQLREIGND
ncbi:MAG: hypothetical protein KF873_20400 [Gemmataceae bacterium]|nr:hypothetical protein [Gemmataceae bacterium]